MLIVFKQGGKEYEYCNVPLSVYQGLVNASSVGTFYDQHVKDKYNCF